MGYLIWVTSIVTLLITLLITTHEPPSRPQTLYPYRIPIDPFQGTLKGTLITTHEPPSRFRLVEGFRESEHPVSEPWSLLALRVQVLNHHILPPNTKLQN